MKAKHVALMILAVMLFLMISQISAQNITYFNNTTEITFEDVNFKIPEGFGVSMAPEDYDELGSHGKTVVYANEAGEEISITVIYDWMGMSLDELYADGANKTAINGYEGWNYTDGNFTCFGYVSEDKGIIISSNNQTRIGEVMT